MSAPFPSITNLHKRDREATWHPEETFHEDDRALFRWKHLGWGSRQMITREGA